MSTNYLRHLANTKDIQWSTGQLSTLPVELVNFL